MTIEELERKHEEVSFLLSEMQATHERSMDRVLEVTRLQGEQIVAQQEEINFLKSCFEILRDKAHALALMVGDLRDRPAGSLRERITTLEEQAFETNWREEVLEQFKAEAREKQGTILPLEAAFDQEVKRLESLLEEV